MPPIGPRYAPHAERSLASPPPMPHCGPPLVRAQNRPAAIRTSSTTAPPRRDSPVSSSAHLLPMMPSPGQAASRQRYAPRIAMATATKLLGMMRRARSVTLQARSTAAHAISSAASSQLVATTDIHAPANTPQRHVRSRAHLGHRTSSRQAATRPAPPTKHAPNTHVTSRRTAAERPAPILTSSNVSRGPMICEHVYVL